jgi:hypothetical protein
MPWGVFSPVTSGCRKNSVCQKFLPNGLALLDEPAAPAGQSDITFGTGYNIRLALGTPLWSRLSNLPFGRRLWQLIQERHTVKTIIALLTIIVAFAYAQSAQADNQRTAIYQKWKAVQAWQEQQNKRVKTIEKQIDKLQKEPRDSGNTNLKSR